MHEQSGRSIALVAEPYMVQIPAEQVPSVHNVKQALRGGRSIVDSLLSSVEVSEEVWLGAHEDVCCKAILPANKIEAAGCPVSNVHDDLQVTRCMLSNSQ